MINESMMNAESTGKNNEINRPDRSMPTEILVMDGSFYQPMESTRLTRSVANVKTKRIDDI